MEEQDWQPDLYNQFRQFRREPVDFILSRLELGPRETMVDLGCGSGENTVELARRSGGGRVLGIDASPAMIGKARELHARLAPELADRVTFELRSMERFEGRADYTLVFSNAALHWIRTRAAQAAILGACYRALAPGGRLVMQLPANHEETASRALSELARAEPWRQWVADTALPSQAVGTPPDYARILGELGFSSIDCHYHCFAYQMATPRGIVDFMRPTTLRPFFERMPPATHQRFLEALHERLIEAYGTSGPLTYPFRRLFIWAAKAR